VYSTDVKEDTLPGALGANRLRDVAGATAGRREVIDYYLSTLV